MRSGGSSDGAQRPGVVLENEAEAPPALLGEWLRERGIAHRIVPAWEGELPAEPAELAWVAVLGSVHSVTQREPGWIPAQLDFLRRALDADVPVLGICFGGQALSAALGGEISAAEPVSLGWLEVESEDPELVPPGPWAHFNSERFSIPPGATALARSPSGPGAFRLGPHLGVQFHPEATPTILEDWAASEPEKLDSAGVTQEEIRAQGERHGEAAAEQAFRLFDAWRALAGEQR